MHTYVAVGLDDGFTGSHQQRIDLDILSTEQTNGSAGTAAREITEMMKHRDASLVAMETDLKNPSVFFVFFLKNNLI